MMLIFIKQHLSNIWSSIHDKVKQHWGLVEKICCLEKKCVIISSQYILYILNVCYLLKSKKTKQKVSVWAN